MTHGFEVGDTVITDAEPFWIDIYGKTIPAAEFVHRIGTVLPDETPNLLNPRNVWVEFFIDPEGGVNGSGVPRVGGCVNFYLSPECLTRVDLSTPQGVEEYLS